MADSFPAVVKLSFLLTVFIGGQLSFSVVFSMNAIERAGVHFRGAYGFWPPTSVPPANPHSNYSVLSLNGLAVKAASVNQPAVQLPRPSNCPCPIQQTSSATCCCWMESAVRSTWRSSLRAVRCNSHQSCPNREWMRLLGGNFALFFFALTGAALFAKPHLPQTPFSSSKVNHFASFCQ